MPKLVAFLEWKWKLWHKGLGWGPVNLFSLLTKTNINPTNKTYIYMFIFLKENEEEIQRNLCTYRSGALKGLCTPCLGQLDKLSTKGWYVQQKENLVNISVTNYCWIPIKYQLKYSLQIEIYFFSVFTRWQPCLTNRGSKFELEPPIKKNRCGGWWLINPRNFLVSWMSK